MYIIYFRYCFTRANKINFMLKKENENGKLLSVGFHFESNR